MILRPPRTTRTDTLFPTRRSSDLYSYGKILLAPGQRLGYLALSPLMPAADRGALSEAFFGAQCSLGWAFPSALMQHAVPDLESLSIDISALTRRRDRMIGALTQWGYEDRKSTRLNSSH